MTDLKSLHTQQSGELKQLRADNTQKAEALEKRKVELNQSSEEVTSLKVLNNQKNDDLKRLMEDIAQKNEALAELKAEINQKSKRLQELSNMPLIKRIAGWRLEED